MTTVAMIGAGSVASRHARVLSQIRGVSVAAVADPSLEAARTLADQAGARAFADPAEAMDLDGIDAVYVCVPPFAHGSIEHAAVKRELPLFVEKPVGRDLDLAARLVVDIESAGLVTGTGYHWRCLDTLPLARQALADSPPLMATGAWLDKRPPVGWWGRWSGSGGQVIEQLTHLLDLARVLLGEPVQVFARGSHTAEAPDPDDIHDATVATVVFETGTVASFTATSALTAKQRASLEVISPGLRLEFAEERLVVDRAGTPTWMTPGNDPRVGIDQDFIAAVRGETEGTCAPYAEAYATHRLGYAITLSAVEGRPIEMAEIP